MFCCFYDFFSIISTASLIIYFGKKYGFTFDEKVQDGDAEIAKCGVKLLVDPMSIQYLRGAEIDYQEGLEGAQFVIKNPNAKTTCGCGSSFST